VSEVLKAPFPYFGGKSRATSLVWERFGKVVNYVEPFFGSGAVLLSCPEKQRPRVETVNDLSCFLANFWRATKGDPDAVASAADYPVIETDLHARHRWLLLQAADLRARLDADPDYFDARIAGWWVWGASAWIGTGWCEEGKEVRIQAPDLGGSTSGDKTYPNHGKGVNAAGMRAPSVRLPDLGGGTQWGTSEPNARAGRGVHSGTSREPSRQLPALSGSTDSGGVTPNFGAGVHALGARTRLYDLFAALSARLRYTRVTCGDWARICTPAVTYRHGLTAVFLDPPYDGYEHLYSAEEHEEPLSARVRRWALEMGERPDMRIALCGYEGEHDMPATWECVAWRAKGGYANAGDGSNLNRHRERVWFSPACLRPGVDTGQIDLFAGRST
jgi:site-specific DNA-adenine methylase